MSGSLDLYQRLAVIWSGVNTRTTVCWPMLPGSYVPLPVLLDFLYLTQWHVL